MKISGNMSKYNKKISFFEILSQIPSNREDWYIFECDAVGKAPNNLTMSEFEDLVLNSKYGYQMSWDELLKFSKEIEDINNLIVVSSTSPVEFETIEKGAEALQVRVEIYDSTTWEIEFYGWSCTVDCYYYHIEMVVFLVDNVITEYIERKTCLAYDMGGI